MTDGYRRVVALLGGDERRVWQGDSECVYQPLRPYARLIERLAIIAGPLFCPKAIDERWLFAEGCTIRLSYLVGGRTATHWIRRANDYLDLRVLIGVNRLIDGAGYRFAAIGAGQDSLIAFVDGAEEARIERALGRECVRFAAADEIAFFSATAGHRLTMQDYAALIAEAGALLDLAPDSADLYEVRGRAFYESGQPESAWVDWAQAAAHGRGDIYAQVAARYGL